MTSDQHSWVALSRVPGIGPKSTHALVQHFGNPQGVLRASHHELREVAGIGPRTAANFQSDEHRRQADAIVGFADNRGIDILCTRDPAHCPPALMQLPGLPPVLYHLGQTNFSNPHTLAVVGTREMSATGARQVERLLDPLVEYAPLIISGLAYGVDICAHRRALYHKLPTLAVLGSGLRHIYPHVHQRTARQIVEGGGGLLTEYPDWIKPQREHFPARNRIVAAISSMTVVVESGVRGGSIITTNMAHDFGKVVGACPGRGGDERTAGCNHLIKTGRAHLVEGGRDVVDLMNWKGASGRRKQASLFRDLDPEQKSVTAALQGTTTLSIDELRCTLGWPPAKLARVLLTLEVTGVIASVPGHRYRMTA